LTIFSDRGSWQGYEWGEGSLLLAVDLETAEWTELGSSAPPSWRALRADHMEARLADGSRVTLRFLDSRTTEIVVTGEARLFGVDAVEPGRYRRIDPRLAEGVDEDLSDVPAALRRNWRVPLGHDRPSGMVASPLGTPLEPADRYLVATVLPTDRARALIREALETNRHRGLPLAAWACSKHPGLLEEFRPEIVDDLRWWESARRPRGEMLFLDEDGGVLSVATTSAYCRERRLLGEPDLTLESLVAEMFFRDGAYRDLTWPDREPVAALTSSTWFPLWCGIASPDHAGPVMDRMLDPSQFGTALPFPSTEAGIVRMPHALFAVEALENYGRAEPAADCARRLLAAAPDWSGYDCLSGKPAGADGAPVPQHSAAAAARRILEERYSES
jgi:hypothetical protein